jgi:predicted RNA-binding Zn ribbon-like protein
VDDISEVSGEDRAVVCRCGLVCRKLSASAGAVCAILVAGSGLLLSHTGLRTVVNLSSYTELAVRLANSAVRAEDEVDPLSSAEAFSAFVAGYPALEGPVYRYDLEALRALRTEFIEIFAAAAGGNDVEAMNRMNALLIRHPVHPELVSHDDQRWHVHLARSGSICERYAAGAVIAISLIVSQYGVNRLGVCAIASCQRVFVDASPNQSRRYCADHAATKTNVTAIRRADNGTATRTATVAS